MQYVLCAGKLMSWKALQQQEPGSSLLSAPHSNYRFLNITLPYCKEFSTCATYVPKH